MSDKGRDRQDKVDYSQSSQKTSRNVQAARKSSNTPPAQGARNESGKGKQ